MQYPVAEISAEIRSSALRYGHPFPLLPAERDHVLALLPNRLLEYDAGQGRTILLRKAEETRLGRFNELVEARDGGAWLAGSNGLAKLPAPIRRLTPESSWQQILPDPSWRNQNFERPYEDDEGGVTVVADSLSTTGRVILRFTGQTWQTPIPAPDKPRFAWRGPDGILCDSFDGRIYVFSHRAPNATVIDPNDGKVLGTIDLGGAPEQAASDGKGLLRAEADHPALELRERYRHVRHRLAHWGRCIELKVEHHDVPVLPAGGLQD